MNPHVTPPAEAQPKLSWFALRFERWHQEGESLGLSTDRLNALSGALGSAAVAFVENDENPSDGKQKALDSAVEELDTVGREALAAVLAFAEAATEPEAVLELAMLQEEDPAG